MKGKIVLLLLIVAMCYCGYLTVHENNVYHATGMTAMERSLCPYWAEADSIVGRANRWTDKWCIVAGCKKK